MKLRHSKSATPTLTRRWADGHGFGPVTEWDMRWLSKPALSGGPARLRGVYLIQFAPGSVYIGMSRANCADRLREHRTRWDDIASVRLMPFDGTTIALRQHERDLIQDAENRGILVRNREHAQRFEGASSLDRVIDFDLQAEWLGNPAAVTAADDAKSAQLPASQIEAYADRYRKLLGRDDHEQLIEVLGTYLTQTIPLPVRTEASFWVSSCFPSSDPARITCVTIKWMETFVLLDQGDDIEAWIWVDKNELPTTDLHRSAFLRRSGVRLGTRYWASGGDHQQHLIVSGLENLRSVLSNPVIMQAAAAFNLSLMRKGRCSQSKVHCAQLATAALSLKRP